MDITLVLLIALGIFVGWKAQPFVAGIIADRKIPRLRARFRSWLVRRKRKPVPSLGETSTVMTSGTWSQPIEWFYATSSEDRETHLVAHYPKGGTVSGRKVWAGAYIIGDRAIDDVDFQKKYTRVAQPIVSRLGTPTISSMVVGAEEDVKTLTVRQRREKEEELTLMAQEYELDGDRS